MKLILERFDLQRQYEYLPLEQIEFEHFVIQARAAIRATGKGMLEGEPIYPPESQNGRLKKAKQNKG